MADIRRSTARTSGTTAGPSRRSVNTWLGLSFKRHRFPPEIIRHAIWLYARFTLSFRDVEELQRSRAAAEWTLATFSDLMRLRAGVRATGVAP